MQMKLRNQKTDWNDIDKWNWEKLIVWAFELGGGQCDQMIRLFVQYLAIYISEILPNRIFFAKVSIKLSQIL